MRAVSGVFSVVGSHLFPESTEQQPIPVVLELVRLDILQVIVSCLGPKKFKDDGYWSLFSRIGEQMTTNHGEDTRNSSH